jgi:hypothetical protein
VGWEQRWQLLAIEARCEEILYILAAVVIANVFPRWPILVTLIMDMLHSSETSFLTRVARRNIPEKGILLSHRREKLKCYSFCHDFKFLRALLLMIFIKHRPPRGIMVTVPDYISRDP